MAIEDDELGACLNLQDIENLARTKMSSMAYEYVAAGAADEITVKWNREAFDGIALKPRVLAGVEQPDLSVSILGTTMPFPILLAPTAYHKMMHPLGEVATASGAGATGATYVVSSATTTSIEEIAAAATAPLWFQVYFQDREFTRDAVQRAVAAGCSALCLTVDTPVLGARDRQIRCGFALPPEFDTPHLIALPSHGPELHESRRVALTWDDVAWLRSVSGVPVVLKGILAGEDAKMAIDSGADGLIVSNHGGRNLDTALATIDALPDVVAAVQGRVPVLLDGGIRRGTDVLKAIARGAAAVLFGRPCLYGLGAGGSDGVRKSIEILRREFEIAMVLTGQTRVTEIDPDVLVHH